MPFETHKKMFVVVHYGLREECIMLLAHVGHNGCDMRNGEVTGIMHTDPSTSTHSVTYESTLFQSVVCHMLHGEQLYPFHIQLVQELQAGNSKFNFYFEFCLSPRHKITGKPVSYVIYSGVIGQIHKESGK
jgi:hypothetical protein